MTNSHHCLLFKVNHRSGTHLRFTLKVSIIQCIFELLI
jgi:hypothetical protein